LWQNKESKMWSADSPNIEGVRVTTFEPEDSVKSLQSNILEKLSKSVIYEMLNTNLTVCITIEILPEEEAKRLLNTFTDVSFD